MFLSHHELNEGQVAKNHSSGINRELHEGENPKLLFANTNSSLEQTNKECCHVNANWQKLRK
jgi:hypothetical protein